MRTFDAALTIERAKKLQGFKHDQELAEFLEVSRTSLASWKRRNSIPARHLLRMVWGSDRTVDWVVNGEEKQTVDEYGFAKGAPHVDPYILWLALFMYRIELEFGNDRDKQLADMLDDQTLSYVHIYLGDFITKLTASKEKWQKSDLVKDKDVYRAVATEFGLGTFEFPPVPWWEDEKII
ncbi:helix-turn-helix domain-containing protein [Pararhizobium gei]|uniref:helix-turn-helix domain-containing protein n=1 Tax=Pararhizobium gei TaxID=1395951 RepID=UPI0023DC8ACF|nr:helix-turn-helix domain-containing protein [Rhizobium gei]